MASVKLTDIIDKFEDSATSGDFLEWVEKLEMVAALQNVSDLKNFLPLFLKGPAFAVYKQINDADKADYQKVKGALLSAFGTNCFVAYELLQRRVLQDGESVDVYLADLKRLTTLMGQGSADPLLKCAFVAGLPADIAGQLKSIVAIEKLSLDELLGRTRMILSTKSSEVSCAVGYQDRRGACYNCGSTYHVSRECSRPRKGHPSKTVRRCFICNETDHLARSCPQKFTSQQGKGSGGASAPAATPGPQ